MLPELSLVFPVTMTADEARASCLPFVVVRSAHTDPWTPRCCWRSLEAVSAALRSDAALFASAVKCVYLEIIRTGNVARRSETSAAAMSAEVTDMPSRRAACAVAGPRA